MFDAPMKQLRSKYSLGRIVMLAVSCAPSLREPWSRSYTRSIRHSRSLAQNAPHSVTPKRSPGNRSNTPDQMRNHRGRDDQKRVSVVKIPTCGP